MHFTNLALIFLLTTINQALPFAQATNKCSVLFYLDATIYVNTTFLAQRDLASTIASTFFQMSSLNSSATVATYGSFLSGNPDPANLFSEFNDFLVALTILTNDYPENSTISDPITAMNAEDGFTSVITVLFTNSPQFIIDSTTINNNYINQTIGVGLNDSTDSILLNSTQFYRSTMGNCGCADGKPCTCQKGQCKCEKCGCKECGCQGQKASGCQGGEQGKECHEKH